MRKIIDQYYYKIYNEVLLFSSNIKEMIDHINPNIFQNNNYLINIYCLLNELEEDLYFPEYVIENLGELIKKIIELNEPQEIIKEISFKYINICDKKSNSKIYLYEYYDKYGTIKELNIKNMEYLEQFDIDLVQFENGIICDYELLYALLNDEEISIKVEYIKSIRKFIIQCPQLFYNKKINKKAISILEQFNNNETNQLISKLKNIKNNNKLFNFNEFLTLYYFILYQNILIDDNCIENISEGFISSIYNYIDSNIIFNPKKNLYNLMSKYRDKIISNYNKEEQRELLEQFNIYLGKLNSINETRDMILLEEKMRNLSDNKDYKQMIKQDLQLLNMFVLDEEKYLLEKEVDVDIDESIVKLYNIVPNIFLDQTIYERTLELAKEKKIKNKIKKIYKR